MIIYSLIMLVTGYFGEVVDPGNAALWGFLQVAYFLIVYEIWMVRLLNWPSCWWKHTCCTQNTMLVCTCRMGYLSIRIHVRTDGWYTGFLGKGALMQFTTSLMLSTKLGLD
jgi:hypothetical protein